MNTHWLVCVLGLCSAPAFAQPVTLADLDGLEIEAKVTREQQIRKDGREFPAQHQNLTKIAFGPGITIQWSVTPTSRSAGGTRQGKTQSGVMALLEIPRESKQTGVDRALWIFEDGVLTTLVTYQEAGAYKRTITFARERGAMTCTATEAYLREEGVGRISLRSNIDGSRVTCAPSRSHRVVASANAENGLAKAAR